MIERPRALDQLYRPFAVALTSLSLLVPLAGCSGSSSEYFPPPDTEGGWRTLTEAGEVSRVAGMDLARLDEAFRFIQGTTKNGGLLVVRDGWLVYENYFGKGHREATANLGSVGKSFTSVAVGMLMAERPDLFPEGLDQRVFTPAYLPPEAFPLSDPGMERIELGQLLAFSACIRGNNPSYQQGEPVALDPIGPDGWQALVDSIALGKADAEIDGQIASTSGFSPPPIFRPRLSH